MARLHKTSRKPRPSQIRMGQGATESAFSSGGVTYQLQRVKCGKKKCGRCRGGPAHGPYWYAYWSAKGRTRSKYIGKKLPAAFDAKGADYVGGVCARCGKPNGTVDRRPCKKCLPRAGAVDDQGDENE